LPHVLRAEILTFCKNPRSVILTTTATFSKPLPFLHCLNLCHQNYAPQQILQQTQYLNGFTWRSVFLAPHCLLKSYFDTIVLTKCDTATYYPYINLFLPYHILYLKIQITPPWWCVVHEEGKNQ
jgi:hypothetical protein